MEARDKDCGGGNQAPAGTLVLQARGDLDSPPCGTFAGTVRAYCIFLIDTFRLSYDNFRLAVLEGYPSGQREQTVNLPALPS